MRIFLIYTVVALFAFSGIANAAMLCCLDDEAQEKHAVEHADKHCHESGGDTNANNDNLSHDCECASCVNLYTLVNDLPVPAQSVQSLHARANDRLEPSDPHLIYYPPRPIS